MTETAVPPSPVDREDAIDGDGLGIAADPKDTRQRILDIALDLFIEQGYEKTSLRQIAEQLGHTKAAVYYHFASKDDILLALHQRVHSLGHDALGQLDQGPVDPKTWAALLDSFVDEMLANRKLFVLHERNRAAIEHLHSEGMHSEHDDFETRFRELLGDPTVPLRTRVRMACSIGAVMGGLVLVGEVFNDVPTAELAEMLSDSVRTLLEVQ